jgi:Na+/melibiose symporter-like transporter
MTATVLSRRQSPSLWLNRRFRTFWIGDTVSQFGDRISELALPYLAVTVLGVGATGTGVLTAAIWAPNLLAVLIGAWVDQRRAKRRLMIVADLLRAGALLTIPAAYLMGALSFAQLIVVALLTGIGQVLFNMAYPTFYVSIVSSESYVDANSKLSMSRGLSFVAGPAAGGGLIQLLTVPFAVLADALSFLFSAWMIRRIRTQEPPPPAHETSTWRIALDGMKLIAAKPILRASLGGTATVNFFTMIANALLILFASRDLGLSAGAIGLAFGVGATGALIGAGLAPAVSRLLGIGRTTILGAVLFPLPLAAAAFASGTTVQKMAVLAAMEFASGVGVMLMDINLNAILTQATPEGARGRRAGAYTAINYGMRPAGALVGGFIGTALGIRPSLIIAGVGGTLCAAWFLASPIRKLRTLGDVQP